MPRPDLPHFGEVDLEFTDHQIACVILALDEWLAFTAERPGQIRAHLRTHVEHAVERMRAGMKHAGSD